MDNPPYVPIADRPLLKPDDAAALLGVSRQTIYDWRNDLGLPAFKFVGSGNYYIRRADLDKWLEEIALRNAA